MKYYIQDEQNLSLNVIPNVFNWWWRFKNMFLLFTTLYSIAVSFALHEECSKPVRTISKYIIKHDTIEIIEEDIPLNDSSLTAELVRQGCVLPAVALAQMKIETLHYKSLICRENKNLAGIRTSQSSFVKGMNRGHCVYNTYKDCIKDYIRVQNEYLNSIHKRYAESEGYVSSIRNVR